jgi:ABC-type transporter Mla MlaB component
MDLAALRRWWPLAAVLVLLFVTSLAATRSQPQLDQIKPDATGTTQAPLLPPTAAPTVTRAGAQDPTPAQGLPDWVGTVAVVLLALVGLIVLGLVVTALLRDQARRRARRAGKLTKRGDNQPRTADELVAALDAGLEELSDADRDPRRAVIACWVRLEQAAAAAGTPRHPGDTPADLVGRLLAEQQVDSAVLAALLEVYRQARYATHTVDDEMRRQARDALQRLREDLGAGVPA